MNQTTKFSIWYKITHKICLSCVVFVLYPTLYFAQNFFPIHYTTTDGLTSNNIYKITQDTEGYIWLATQNGLCRFSGQRFTSYYPSEMKDQDVIQLEAAPDSSLVGFVNLTGQLGLANRSGVELIDFGEEGHGQLLDLTFDDKGNIWIWDRDCRSIECKTYLIKFDLKTKSYTKVLTPINSLADIVWDNRDEKIFVMGQQIIEYPPTGELSTKFDFRNLIDHPLHKTLLPIGRSPIPRGKDSWFFLLNLRDTISNSYWVHLASWEEKAPKFINWTNAPESFSIYTLVQAPNGSYWVGSNQGLFEAKINDSNQGTLLNHYLPNNFIQSLFLDNKKNLWIGSKSSGLFLLPENRNPVYSKKILGYKGKGPRKIAANALGVWGICDEGKLFQISNNGKLKTYHFPKLKEFHQVYNGKGNELLLSSDLQVYNFNPETLDLIEWNIPEMDRQGFRFSKNFVRLTCSKDILFIEDNVWIASCQRFFHIDLKKKYANAIFWGRSTAVFWDKIRSVCWISSRRGLHLYSPVDSLSLVRDKEGRSFDFLTYTMSQDKDGNIYFGTHGKGLWCWKDSTFQEIGPQSEQLGKTYSDIMVCGDWLWTISEKGLVKLNLNTWEILPVSGTGLNSELYNFVKWDKHMWVSSSEGIIKLPIHSPQTSTDPQKVFLESFEAQNNAGEKSTKKILSHHFDQISIDFSTPTFGTKPNYEYRINDGNWQNFSQPPLLLSALKPEKYTVQIRTKGVGVTSASDPLSLYFQIKNPIWLRPDVIFFSLLMGTGLILMLARNYYRQRYRRLEEKERMLREIEVLRIRALQAQMNPHFTFNALNAIQEQLLNNDSMAAVNYLGDFARLIRRTLEMVDRPYVSLTEEIEFLETYIRLELIRREKEVKIVWNIEDSLHLSQIMIPPMLIQPLIENSFKHGLLPKIDQPQLSISIQQEENTLVCSVEDNGIGIIASMQKQKRTHESHGTRLIKDRLAILAKEGGQKSHFRRTDLSLDSLLSGTRSIICIPLNIKKAHN